MIECSFPNHRYQSREAAERNHALGLPAFYISRCAHFGGRGVVETRHLHGGYVFVDYVQWEPQLACEATSWAVGEWATEGDVERAWQRLNEKLLNDEPPDEDC